MTNLEALIILHATQTFLRIRDKDGGFYGLGFFQKRDWIGNLANENRRVSLRLAQNPCIRCKTPLSSGSTGDHIIPLAAGGPQGAQNYLPLCRSCNSSKGKKDLLVWWHESGRLAIELPADVICAYARLMFGIVKREALAPAPDHLKRAAEQLLTSLPSRRHALALLNTAQSQSRPL